MGGGGGVPGGGAVMGVNFRFGFSGSSAAAF